MNSTILALLKKDYLLAKRSKKFTFFHAIFPAVIILACSFSFEPLMSSSDTSSKFDRKAIDPEKYEPRLTKWQNLDNMTRCDAEEFQEQRQNAKLPPCNPFNIVEYGGLLDDHPDGLLNLTYYENDTIHGAIQYDHASNNGFEYTYYFPDGTENNLAFRGEEFAGHMHQRNIEYMEDYLNITIPSSNYHLGIYHYLSKPVLGSPEDNYIFHCLTLCFLMSIVGITRNIVSEKASVKPYLSAMGLSTITFYISHFLFSIFKCFLILLSLYFIAKTKPNGIMLFSGYVLYFFCAVSFSFLMSAIFTKTKTALEGVVIVWISMLIAKKVVTVENPYYFVISSISPIHAFSNFLQITSEQHKNRVAVFGRNIYEGLDEKVFLIAMGVDIIWMLALTFAIDWTKKKIGEIGCKNMFRSSCCVSKPDPEEHDNLLPENTAILSNGIEIDEAREEATADIDLKGLRKVYSSGEKAVDGLTLRAIRGQVSVLLGHNGCGKSTTFSMISGMTNPTSGSITIEDIDAIKDRRAARRLIGLCPQYNPLYGNLTVMEHLELVHKLKDGDLDEFDDEAGQFMKAIDLTSKANTLAKNLSGGMKRKLCVCMALIGGSRVILLDEPTAGMDPGARQDVQRLLEKIKSQRTILLTTHYMDEADRLGDWIFVMSRGKMATCGSSGFLKKKYGAGYLLTVVVENTTGEEEIESDYLLVDELCSLYVDEAEVKDTRGQMIEVSLPEDQKPSILKLLKALEAVIHKDFTSADLDDLPEELRSKLSNLSITTIGLSLKSLEQVFIKIGEECDTIYEEKEKNEKKNRIQNYNRLIEARAKPELEGSQLYISQLIGLFHKRFVYSIRNKTQYITQLLIPMIIMLSVTFSTFSTGILTSKTYNLTSYPESTAIIWSDLDTTRIGKYLAHFDQITVKRLPLATNLSAYLDNLSKDDERVAFVILYIGPQRFDLFYNVQMDKDALIIMTNLLSNLLIADDRNEIRNATILAKAKWIETKEMIEKSKDPGIEKYGFIPSVVLFGFALCTSPFVAYLVEEKSSKFTHQQLLTGLSPLLFWMSNSIWDFCIFGFLAFFYAVVVLSLGLFKGYYAILPLLFFCYFITVVPIIYLVTNFMKSPTKSSILFLLYSTLVPLSASLLLRMFHYDSELEKKVYQIIAYLLIPQFPFFVALEKTIVVSCTLLPREEFTKKHGFYNLMSWDGIGIELVTMLGVFVITILLMITQNNRFVRRWIFYRFHRKQRRSEKRDLIFNDTDCESVEKERNLIKSEKTDGCVVVVDDLIKKYGSFRALNGISLTVRRNECFGLLGTNGAGKTTTFDILTSVTFPNGGTAIIDGNDVTEMAHIGYCPQFDAILPELNGKQVLTIMARLNGYSDPGDVAMSILHCVDMVKHRFKTLKRLSGGQKRKLSVGIALLSRSKCVMLDEPTAGIDPRARRDIWDVMIWLRQKCGTSLVLTSHSMEECEAMCTRIAVMKNGEVVALGTSQELKSQYGNTYTMTLTLHKYEDRQQVCAAVAEKMPLAVLKTSSTNITLNIVWQLPKMKFDKWSEKFELVQNLATELKVRDFMLIQSSLEDVFISITGSNI